MKKIELVVPCYNEEECIEPFVKEVKHVLDNLMDWGYIITFVDDGSRDNTLQIIKNFAKNDDRIHYISFSRNFGKEAAMYAGLSRCEGDLIVLIDADLQHPPTVIPRMIEEIEKGHDCCGAKRVSRKGEPPIRSAFSKLFYQLINKVTGMHLVQGGSDFRMMTKQMADAIVSLSERERFIKGIMSWVGFDTVWIDYENVERFAGKTKWSFLGLTKYALNGFISFATTPLRAVVWLGLVTVAISVIAMIRMYITFLIHGTSGNGWLTLVFLIMFFSGIIITILGIIGEYIARIYHELKHRPIYIEKDSNIESRR